MTFRTSYRWSSSGRWLSLAVTLTAMIPGLSLVDFSPVRSNVVWGEESATAVPSITQEADDESPILKPAQVRQAADQAKLDAMSWYLAARALENRNEAKQALNAYRKAIELDPNLIDVYRAAVPLAFRLDQVGEAVRMAMKAVELDPNDYELLRQLGIHMASQKRVAEAIRYLDRAANAPSISKNSPTYVQLMRDLGILYTLVGEKAKAAEAYLVILKAVVNPDEYELDFRAKSAILADPRTNYERIGQVLLEGGQVAGATEAFELAAKSGKTSPGNLNYYRAKVLLLNGDGEGALAELQKYLDAQRQTRGKEAYELLAQILEKLDRKNELLDKLQGLAADDPRNSTLQYFYADQLIEAGKLAEARAHYEQSLKDAGDVMGYVGLAGVLRRQNDAESLLDVLAKGLANIAEDAVGPFEAELMTISENQPLVQSMLAVAEKLASADPAEISFEKSLLVAKLAGEIKQFPDAIRFYRLCLTLSKERAVMIYGELGELLIKNRDYGTASEVYEEAANNKSLTERRPNYLFMLSQVRELNGETDKALEAIREAKTIIPEAPLLHFQEGWIYFHSRQFEKAIATLEEVLKKYGEQKEIARRCSFTLSSIYVFQGEMRKAEEILEVILETEPDDPSVNNDLGYLYADQGKNLEQAEKMIRKAVAAEPDNAAYLDSLGWVLFRLGKTEEAIEYLKKALDISTGSDATLYDHLADCYEKLGQFDEARKGYETALKELAAEKNPDLALKARIEEKLSKLPAPKDQAAAPSEPAKTE
jgi:tetratricopeptide (TPR) repeat protein